MKTEIGNLDQSTVLIISDDPEFSGAITGRWQSERNTPPFTLMKGDLCQGMDPDTFAVAIVGAVRAGGLTAALRALEPAGQPVLLVSEDSRTAREVREAHPRVMVLRQHEGWLDALVLIVTESLRRSEMMDRLKRAERAGAHLQHQATLGTYMLEMRHGLNNALTSVLGNSELLLLDPGQLSADARAQIETIRNMSLRMHEVMQRFSSLEKELRVVERQAAGENRAKSQSAGASS
jgi:signal transduction histidine kinase